MAKESLSFFERMSKSMFDVKSYEEIINAPLKKAVVYLVLFGLFIGSLGMVKHMVYYNDYFNDISTDFSKRVPEFKIEDGKLIMESEDSFIRKQQDFEFVINPSLESDKVEIEPTSGVYFTKDAVVLKSIISNDVIKYNSYEGNVITKDLLLEYLGFFKNVSLAVLVIMGTIVGLFSKVINSFIVGLIGMMINKSNNYEMSFKNIYKIGIHALTFPSVIALFVDILFMNMPFFTIIYFGIVAMYYSRILRILNVEE